MSDAAPAAAHGFAAVIAMPFGRLGIRNDAERVAGVEFLPPGTALRPPDCLLAERAVEQFQGWLTDPDRPFDLPLATCGTPFQRRVWHAISGIRCGQVRSYGTLAALLGSAPRAIGQACRANPFPLIVPCHRVVSATGIGGFAGARAGDLLETKKWLLAFEARR